MTVATEVGKRKHHHKERVKNTFKENEIEEKTHRY